MEHLQLTVEAFLGFTSNLETFILSLKNLMVIQGAQVQDLSPGICMGITRYWAQSDYYHSNLSGIILNATSILNGEISSIPFNLNPTLNLWTLGESSHERLLDIIRPEILNRGLGNANITIDSAILQTSNHNQFVLLDLSEIESFTSSLETLKEIHPIRFENYIRNNPNSSLTILQ